MGGQDTHPRCAMHTVNWPYSRLYGNLEPFTNMAQFVALCRAQHKVTYVASRIMLRTVFCEAPAEFTCSRDTT
jgi:hypothetical protein